MIIPRYWAEGRLQHKADGKQVTVRRFGWSDTGQADAQVMADQRTKEALARILQGENLRRREPKEAYGGADGLPIREEVILSEGDAVVTRNGYGSLCLNTPDVMFIDIDKKERVSAGAGRFPLGFVLMAATAAVAIWTKQALWLAVGFALWMLIRVIRKPKQAKWRAPQEEKPVDPVLERIRKFSAAHPEWNLQVYRTPAGYRVLVMHDLFDPRGAGAVECFSEMAADKVYARMCHTQTCFRARVSPKPWRVGMGEHLRPSPGVWPVADEHLPKRLEWVREYDGRSAGFASCEWVEALGSRSSHPKAEVVKRLHDDLSRARSGLPLA